LGLSRRIEILTCEKCSTEIQDGASFCPKCGLSLSVAQIGPVYVPQNARPPETIPEIPQVAVPVKRPAFAGFWRRAVAFLIDNLIIGFLFTIVIAFDIPRFTVNFDLNAPTLKQIPQLTPLGFIVAGLMIWMYYALFEASAWQATPGKRILGLYVSDLGGRRLTFSRATIRNVAKMIPIVSAVGYFLAGFTEKKQALHDMIAGCLVLRRP
jgi:uncharacterized RDD family membrane protein YckC